MTAMERPKARGSKRDKPRTPDDLFKDLQDAFALIQELKEEARERFGIDIGEPDSEPLLEEPFVGGDAFDPDNEPDDISDWYPNEELVTIAGRRLEYVDPSSIELAIEFHNALVVLFPQSHLAELGIGEYGTTEYLEALKEEMQGFEEAIGNRANRKHFDALLTMCFPKLGEGKHPPHRLPSNIWGELLKFVGEKIQEGTKGQ